MNLLYEDLTYRTRGAIFTVHKTLGSGHKESVYRKALAQEFKKQGISYLEEVSIPIFYNQVKVGVYRPDFIVSEKIIIEIKAVQFLSKDSQEQMSHYLAGSSYCLGLLVNFGQRRAEIKRVIFDSAREVSKR